VQFWWEEHAKEAEDASTGALKLEAYDADIIFCSVRAVQVGWLAAAAAATDHLPQGLPPDVDEVALRLQFAKVRRSTELSFRLMRAAVRDDYRVGPIVQIFFFS
jgi:hypothetical protein